MREIALDTETTGLKPADGHRIIEIACLEMTNRLPTGKYFHTYINPERDVPPDAFAIHGISTDFLKDKPKFTEIAEEFFEFIGDSRLIIHNAAFDMMFLNAELTWARKKEIPISRTFCTLLEARRRFPGSPASLDALCKRFNIDLSARTRHGALLDAELLADMYLELMGGVQVALELNTLIGPKNQLLNEKTVVLPSRKFLPSDKEIEAHKEFLKKIKDPLWLRVTE